MSTSRGELVPARCPRTGRIKLSVPKRAWKFHHYDGPARSSAAAQPPRAPRMTRALIAGRGEHDEALQPESPPFNCELCPESYASWPNLLLHVKECHP